MLPIVTVPIFLCANVCVKTNFPLTSQFRSLMPSNGKSQVVAGIEGSRGRTCALRI